MFTIRDAGMVVAIAGTLVLADAGRMPAAAQEIGGRYAVEGQNPGGRGTYRGTAEISGTRGGNCQIRWALENTPPSSGFCLRQDNVLAVSYRLRNSLGLVIYQLQPDGSLDGVWSISGEEGLGRERLVPRR
jgi:hypothetical protein